MPKIKKIHLLIFAILLCEGVGILGSIFTFQSIPNWYQYLNKPSFSPPNYVFGPVWTTLYALMGTSLYIVWMSKNKTKDVALKFFYLQLFLNFIWTPIFFGLKNPGFGLIVIISMWISIVVTIVKFQKISKPASYLLYPYLLWVSFASVLNYYIWILNY